MSPFFFWSQSRSEFHSKKKQVVWSFSGEIIPEMLRFSSNWRLCMPQKDSAQLAHRHSFFFWIFFFLLICSFHRVVRGFCWCSAEMGPTREGVVATPVMNLKEALGPVCVLCFPKKIHHSSPIPIPSEILDGPTPSTTVSAFKTLLDMCIDSLGIFRLT